MPNKIPPLESQTNLNYLELGIYKCYRNSKFLSIKHSSYFQVYEELINKYRSKKITFVEIGVLNGGSLFMWRNYLGKQARIIGIDLNPIAKKWEKDGFEIHIGNQADPAFWNDFFSTVGNVDIILDDGGHTNEQQITSTHECIPHINDGGILIIEDVHTSYLKKFGNPTRYSFINYAKSLIDSINSRFPKVHASKNNLNKFVNSVSFFESIVCFSINRSKCFESSPTSNEGISFNAEDFRRQGSKVNYISNNFKFLEKFSFIKRFSKHKFSTLRFLSSKLRSRKLKKYFY